MKSRRRIRDLPGRGPVLWRRFSLARTDIRQRVAIGHRLMRPAPDIFLECDNAPMADGCTRHKDQGFGGNVQRRNVGCLRRTCVWVLARAHSSASEISAAISSYLDSSNDEFDAAMGDFALAHADQAERDHAVLKAAVRKR
jgi:hypothetical protein